MGRKECGNGEDILEEVFEVFPGAEVEGDGEDCSDREAGYERLLRFCHCHRCPKWGSCEEQDYLNCEFVIFLHFSANKDRPRELRRGLPDVQKFRGCLCYICATVDRTGRFEWKKRYPSERQFKKWKSKKGKK